MTDPQIKQGAGGVTVAEKRRGDQRRAAAGILGVRVRPGRDKALDLGAPPAATVCVAAPPPVILDL